MNIAGVKIGQDERPYIVAELSANHGGLINAANQANKIRSYS